MTKQEKEIIFKYELEYLKQMYQIKPGKTDAIDAFSIIGCVGGVGELMYKLGIKKEFQEWQEELERKGAFDGIEEYHVWDSVLASISQKGGAK